MIGQPQPPFSKSEVTTLRQIAADPKFAGWKVKVVKDEPCIISLDLYFATYRENDPVLDIIHEAYYNENGTVVLLVGYPSMPVIQLLNWTAALDYK